MPGHVTIREAGQPIRAVLATLLIRHGAKITGVDMIGFDSVCENAAGKYAHQSTPKFTLSLLVSTAVFTSGNFGSKARDFRPWVSDKFLTHPPVLGILSVNLRQVMMACPEDNTAGAQAMLSSPPFSGREFAGW